MDFGVASGQRMERRASYVDRGARAALSRFFFMVNGLWEAENRNDMVIDYRIFGVWRLVDGRESGHFVPVAIMSTLVAGISHQARSTTGQQVSKLRRSLTEFDKITS